MKIIWECEDKKAKIIQVEADCGTIELPEKIEGCPVYELADYCFAGKEKQLPKQVRETVLQDKRDETKGMGNQKICGDLLEKLILPKTLKKIGDYAFYNCRKLEELHVGKRTTQVGSDAFMNTISLQKLVIQSSAKEATGLRQLLAQLPSDMEVSFLDARVFYPEYFETYDEIAPAHLFGRNITGEGFRARLCFINGRLDFHSYDAIFDKACAEEGEETLCCMAWNRILFPVELSEGARWDYESYLRNHMQRLLRMIIRKRSMEELKQLTETKLLETKDMEAAVLFVLEEGWAEAAAFLIGAKKEEKQQRKKQRYQL